MKNSVLRTITTLSCLLISVYAQVPPMQDFSLEKITGKWFLVGVASNADWFVNHKATMKTGTAMLTPTEEGDLDISYANLNADGSCWRMNNLAKKTDTAGHFTYHNTVWNNDNDMRVTDAVYDNYALTYTIKTKDDASHVLINLYSRSAEVSAEVGQKFTQLSSTSGILTDNIVLLPKNEECAAV